MPVVPSGRPRAAARSAIVWAMHQYFHSGAKTIRNKWSLLNHARLMQTIAPESGCATCHGVSASVNDRDGKTAKRLSPLAAEEECDVELLATHPAVVHRSASAWNHHCGRHMCKE